MFEMFLYAGIRYSKVVRAYSSKDEFCALSHLMKASSEGLTLSFGGYLVYPVFDGREQTLKALEILPKKICNCVGLRCVTVVFFATVIFFWNDIEYVFNMQK